MACIVAGFGSLRPQAFVDGDLVADSLLGTSSGSSLLPVAAFGSPSRFSALISRLRTCAPFAMSSGMLIFRPAAACGGCLDARLGLAGCVVARRRTRMPLARRCLRFSLLPVGRVDELLHPAHLLV